MGKIVWTLLIFTLYYSPKKIQAQNLELELDFNSYSDLVNKNIDSLITIDYSAPSNGIIIGTDTLVFGGSGLIETSSDQVLEDPEKFIYINIFKSNNDHLVLMSQYFESNDESLIIDQVLIRNTSNKYLVAYLMCESDGQVKPNNFVLAKRSNPDSISESDIFFVLKYDFKNKKIIISEEPITKCDPMFSF